MKVDYLFCLSTDGGVHEPSMTAAFSQYARQYSEKLASLGAGSQFDFCAKAGSSACT